MKLLHLADIHLDRAFRLADGSARRAELRAALDRGLALAADHAADAVCLAGDVYEHETVREDTARYLRDRLESVERPVVVTPGNHDPHLPGSVWERTRWPGNVHVFRHDRLEPHELPGGTVIWGAAFTAQRCSARLFADGWRAPADGRSHLLLLHAALTGEQWADEPGHRPVTRAQLATTGTSYAMLGHFHNGRADELICYPGSPEPLGFGERAGHHGAALLTVADGGVTCELIPLAARVYAEETLRVDGAAGSADVEGALAAVAERRAGTCLLVTLEGEVDPGCEIVPDELEERCRGGLAELHVRDRTYPAYDLDALAGEQSARGRFVRRMRASDDPLAPEALYAGLRAIDGRREVLV